MNFYVFASISALACILIFARGLAMRVTIPLPTAVIVLAWVFYLVGRTVAVGRFDVPWMTYALAGTLLAVLSLVPTSIKVPAAVLRGWEVGYLVLCGTYVVWSVVGGLYRASVIFDANTEGLMLLVLSAPIWLRYASNIPLHLWAVYGVLLAVTLSRSSALMVLCLIAGAVTSRFAVRKEIIAPTFVLVGLLTFAVVSFDPSMMPPAAGPARFLSLNDNSFYERRALVVAAVTTLTSNLDALLWGSSIIEFAQINGNVVHNGFLELFLAGGIVGGTLFVALYGVFVATYLSRRNLGLFLGYTLASGFSVLLLNSELLLLFVAAFVMLGRITTEDVRALPVTA